MKRLIGIALALMLLLSLVGTAMAESQGRDMWVCTPNGKNLYVRSSMSTKDDSNIVGSLPYGRKVVTYGGNYNGWTLIDYGDGSGDTYVMWRFLVSEPPAPYQKKESGEASSSTSSKEFSTKDASTVAQMNSLVASAKYVTPYEVYVRPTRASGWVYVRWFPSKSATAVATYPANTKLLVIAELKDWYQVCEPESGKTGFVYKSYVN